MLSTVLFIDDTPVGYEVQQKGTKLLFTPTQFSSRSYGSPLLSLTRVDGLWLIDGEVERSLRVQVFQSLERLKAGGLLE
jgi:hypothetical protein